MNDMNKTDFATAMFRKGSNTVELVFAERLNRAPDKSGALCSSDATILDMMLLSFLLGVCSCLNDQTSFLELRQAIDNVWP